MKKINLAGSHRSEPDYKFGDNDGVMYIISGSIHIPHLMAAVYQLREELEFKGNVCVVTTDNSSKSIVEMMCKDPLFDIKHVHHEIKKTGKGKGGHYAKKTQMMKLSPFSGRTVFLDADTLVMNVDEKKDHHLGRMMPPNAYTPEVMLTQFSNWTTDGGIMRSRLKKWKNIEGCALVPVMMANPYPAINTGVVGFSKLSAKFMKEWQRVTLRNMIFICDEIAAQIIHPDFPHVIRLQRYNASVIYSKELDPNDVVVWHGHGSKFAKSFKGRQIFCPIFLKAVSKNFAKFNEWRELVNKSKIMKMFEQGKYHLSGETWSSQFKAILNE